VSLIRRSNTPDQGQNGKEFEYTNTPIDRSRGSGHQLPGHAGNAGAVDRHRAGPSRTDAEGKRLGEVATQIHTEANTAKTGRADLDMLAAQGPNIAMPARWRLTRRCLIVSHCQLPALTPRKLPAMKWRKPDGRHDADRFAPVGSQPDRTQQAMMLASMPTPESSSRLPARRPAHAGLG
jgi:hypothetical protein